VGTTPQIRVKVPVGRHRIVLENDEVNCKRTILVTVRPGEEVRQQVRCGPPEKLVVDSSQPWDEPTPVTRDASSQDAAPMPAKSPLRYGQLMLNSMPWSKVYIDGRYIGTTPVLRHKVLAGRHRVTFKAQGYEPKRISVVVEPNATVSRIIRIASPD
jgi:serine/threonine-protein kinase